MKKVSFIDGVLAFLKGGDVAKMTRFSSKLQKYFDKQIKQREDKVESLEDKKVDANEALEETILNVDLGQINQTEGAEGYCPRYVSNVKRAKDAVDALQAEIDTLNEEIKELEGLQAIIFTEKEVAEVTE